jgi:hypothetical protein
MSAATEKQIRRLRRLLIMYLVGTTVGPLFFVPKRPEKLPLSAFVIVLVIGFSINGLIIWFLWTQIDALKNVGRSSYKGELE